MTPQQKPDLLAFVRDDGKGFVAVVLLLHAVATPSPGLWLRSARRSGRAPSRAASGEAGTEGALTNRPLHSAGQELSVSTELNAGRAGTFCIGGQTQINRLGFGAMRITGPGQWDEPEDRGEALRTLKRLPALGVNFIDTADSYGPDVSEQLIREALHPYPDDLFIATKAGLARTGPDQWFPLGRPEYLIQQAHKSRRNLGVEQIALWQLHRIDPKVPRDEQFAAVKSLLDDGIIRYAGLSQASVAEIEAAARVFKVATVQNRYNLVDRSSEEVLDYCTKHGIGFIPWFPLAAGSLTQSGSLLDTVAKRHEATPSQVALAWVLKRSPVILPIPGTSKVKHLAENVAAVDVELSHDEFAALDRAGRAASGR